MSCRKTHGNSAVTSLTRFVTGASEKTVSQEFHAARRDAKSSLGTSGKELAPQAEVHTYLEKLFAETERTNKIPDTRRQRVLSRIDEAHKDTANGEGPDKETFRAWQQVRSYVRNVEKLRKETEPEDPSEVLYATKDEVSAAYAAYEQAEYAVDPSDTASAGVPRSLTTEMRQIRSLREKLERLQASYDQSPAGFRDILHDYRAHGATNLAVASRYRAAVEARIGRQAPPSADKSATTDPRGLQTARDTARVTVQRAETTYRATPTARNKKQYDEKVVDYRRAQTDYLSSVSARHPIFASLGKDDSVVSVQSWSKIGKSDDVPRSDLWAAAEMQLRNRDRQHINVGRITEVEASRRALQRAEARQLVLDSEGRNEIDPVNKAFAETIRRKRRI